MRNRSSIWLMLAVIALQGTGMLRALHLAMEHSTPGGLGCSAGHCCHAPGCEHPADQNGSTTPSIYEGQGAGHGHGHHHDPATCPVCQALAKLKAVSADPTAVSSTGPCPAYYIGTPDSFPLPQIALATLGPRAPPIC